MNLIQGEHEYNASKHVEREKYNNRWYNWEAAYCAEVMDLQATSFFDLEESNLQSSIFTAGGIGVNIEDHPGDDDSRSKLNEHDSSFPHDDDDDHDNEIDKENESRPPPASGISFAIAFLIFSYKDARSFLSPGGSVQKLASKHRQTTSVVDIAHSSLPGTITFW
jgi:hypothetical protein